MASPRRALAEAILAAGLAASEDLAFSMDHEGFGDIRRSDWSLLRLAHRELMPVGALALRLDITQQATTKALRALEDREYVCRAVAARDGRIREVTLAPRGRDLLAAADAWAVEHQRFAVARWGSRKVQSATTLLSDFETTAERFSPVGRNLRAAVER